MEWIYDRRKEKGLKMVDKRTWGSPPPTNRNWNSSHGKLTGN